jgi:hypothetical protein
VLPTGVAPVTSIITILRHGPSRSAQVTFATGEDRKIAIVDLADYVTEARNPANMKRVTTVDVFLPHPLLAGGLCLVDTPGVGSVFVLNAEVTHAFVPQIDAALIVLGGDPPISREELNLIEVAAGQIDRLIVVLNKSDRLSDDDRRAVRAFTECLLGAHVRVPAGSLHEVSATERLETGRATRDWDALERALYELAADSSAVVAQADARAREHLASRLLNEIEERHGALTRPIAESERRVARLQEAVHGAERALGDLGALFTEEQARLARDFDGRRQQFLATSRDAARRELSAEIAALDKRPGPALRQRAYQLAQEKARVIVFDWLRQVEPDAEDTYRRSTGRFIEMANRYLDRLRGSGEPSFAGLADRMALRPGFRIPRRFVETDVLRLTGCGPIKRILDVVGPRSVSLRAIRKDVGKYFDYLLEVNSSRVEHDLNERVRESRRALEAEIRSLLGDIVGSVRRALADARARHTGGQAAVRLELDRLAVFHREVTLARSTPEVRELEKRS